MNRTTVALDVGTRDDLATIAQELGTTSLDKAIQALVWEHRCHAALARLDADPRAALEYQAEALRLAEIDVEVTG